MQAAALPGSLNVYEPTQVISAFFLNLIQGVECNYMREHECTSSRYKNNIFQRFDYNGRLHGSYANPFNFLKNLARKCIFYGNGMSVINSSH